MIPYKVTLTIGTTTYVSDSSVDQDPNAPAIVVDPLILDWSTLEGEWPPQPNPSTLTVNLRSSKAGLPPLETGTTVKCIVSLNDGTWFDYLEFQGTIGSVDVDAVDSSIRPLGVTIVSTDLDTVLGETYVSDTPWTAFQLLDESATGRVKAIENLAAAAGVTITDPGSVAATGRGIGRGVIAASLRDLVNEICACAWSPGAVCIYGVDVAGVVYPAGTVYHSLRYKSGMWAVGPLLWTLAGGVVSLTMSPWRTAFPNAATGTTVEDFIDGCSVIDACHIATDSLRYHRDRAKAPTVVELAAEDSASAGRTVTHPQRIAKYGRITKRLTSLFAYTTSGNQLDSAAAAMIGDEATADDWQLDRLTVRVDKIPTDQVRSILYGGYGEVSWFPRRFVQPSGSQAALKRAWPYGRQVVVINPDPAITLSARAYLTGLLSGATATIAGGRLELSARLAPGMPSREIRSSLSYDGRSPTWQHLADNLTVFNTHWKTTTPYIDPALSWVDLRLSRLPT